MAEKFDVSVCKTEDGGANPSELSIGNVIKIKDKSTGEIRLLLIQAILGDEVFLYKQVDDAK